VGSAQDACFIGAVCFAFSVDWLSDCLERLDSFARASPERKLVLVIDALRQLGGNKFVRLSVFDAATNVHQFGERARITHARMLLRIQAFRETDETQGASDGDFWLLTNSRHNRSPCWTVRPRLRFPRST